MPPTIQSRCSAPHDTATEPHLMENRPPAERPATRQPAPTCTSPFWAQALAEQTDDAGWRHRAARGNHEHRTGERDPSPERRSGQRGGLGGYRPDATKADRHASGGHVQRFARSRWRLNSGVDGLTAPNAVRSLHTVRSTFCTGSGRQRSPAFARLLSSAGSRPAVRPNRWNHHGIGPGQRAVHVVRVHKPGAGRHSFRPPLDRTPRRWLRQQEFISVMAGASCMSWCSA